MISFLGNTLIEGGKMRKNLLLTWMIVVITCTGCIATIQKTPEIIIITPTSAIILRPFMSHWEMVDLPPLSHEKYPVAIYAMRFNRSRYNPPIFKGRCGK